MKSNIIKAIIGSGVALAVALATWAPLHVQAGDQVKGATKLLQPSQSAPPSSAPAKAMACPKCTDVTVKNVNVEKGHIRTMTLAVGHGCGGCSTTMAVTGEGKAKSSQAVHGCTAGGAVTSCCAIKTN